MKVLIAGDSIIDWIIKDQKVTPTVGGAGNIVRGLKQRGNDVEFLTLYNPMLYPMSYTMDLHPNSLTDFDHRNVFIRDYDKHIFHRFRENLKTNVIDVKHATAVICHEDSIIRRFEAFYADVRDTSVKGKCEILRMSSTDDYYEIMTNIDFKLALVTHKDSVEIYTASAEWADIIEFPEITAVDDIGAGDSFNVGFLDYILYKGMDMAYIEDAIKRGIEVAQEKVTNVGVFLND